MKKVHLHFTLLLTALCLSSACNSGQKANGASASDSTSVDSAMVQETMVENETFTTDSVVFNKENEHASCYICVDIPKGNAKVVPTISKYITTKLMACNPNYEIGEEAKQSVSGMPTDVKMQVDFFGKRYLGMLTNDHKDACDVLEGENKEEDWKPSPFSQEINIRIKENTEKYVTYHLYTYNYMGGAHGQALFIPVTFLKSTGEMLQTTIDSSNEKAIQPLIRKGVISYFKKRGETVTDRDLNTMLFIENGIIPIPINAPSLTAKGLHFVYQQYEIGPYAIGMVEFTVPYDKIKAFMTSEAKEGL